MVDIIFLTLKIILLLIFVGIGFTYIFIPTKLKRDAIWLAPWFGLILISVLGVIFSQGKIAMELGGKIILSISGLLLIFALITKKISLKFSKEFWLILLLTVICFTYNIFPLLTKVGFPTTLSLGNLDPLSYNAVGDFLIKNTIFAGGDFQHYKPFLWATGDLIHSSYRWGSPMILSFFSSILQVRSFEIYTLIITLFFALSFPLVYILSKRAIKLYESKFLLFSIFLTYAINSTLLYMLYNAFFAQFIFMGAYLIIGILLFEYEFDEYAKKQFFNKYDLLLAITISSLTTNYPESLLFVLAPILIYCGLSSILYRDYKYFLIFFKVTLLTVVINPVTFGTSVIANYRIILSSTIKGIIGWENIPFAAPLEIMGFYNLYYSRNIPGIYDLLIGIPIIGIWLYALKKIHKPVLFFSYILFFVPFYIGLRFVFPNFFSYHRIITYSVFLFVVLFCIGIMFLVKQKKYKMLVLSLILILTVRSSYRTFYQFYWHTRSADKSIISLQELNLNNKVNEPFFTSDVYLGEYDLWTRIWREYILMNKLIVTRQNYPTERNYLKGIKLVLSEKNRLSYEEKKIIYKRIDWDNEYYELGEIEQLSIAEDLKENK